jgi:hypothetical protein
MQFECFGVLNVSLLSETLKDIPATLLMSHLGTNNFVSRIISRYIVFGRPTCNEGSVCTRSSESGGDIVADSSSWRGSCIFRSNTAGSWVCSHRP